MLASITIFFRPGWARTLFPWIFNFGKSETYKPKIYTKPLLKHKVGVNLIYYQITNTIKDLDINHGYFPGSSNAGPFEASFI